MSDYLGLHLSNQTGMAGSAWDAEVIPWGSTETSDAVKRICQGLARRCHQAIATHNPADILDEQVGAAP